MYPFPIAQLLVRPSTLQPACPVLVPVLKLTKYKAVVNIPDTQTPERYVPWNALMSVWHPVYTVHAIAVCLSIVSSH